MSGGEVAMLTGAAEDISVLDLPQEDRRLSHPGWQDNMEHSQPLTVFAAARVPS